MMLPTAHRALKASGPKLCAIRRTRPPSIAASSAISRNISLPSVPSSYLSVPVPCSSRSFWNDSSAGTQTPQPTYRKVQCLLIISKESTSFSALIFLIFLLIFLCLFFFFFISFFCWFLVSDSFPVALIVPCFWFAWITLLFRLLLGCHLLFHSFYLRRLGCILQSHIHKGHGADSCIDYKNDL